MGFTKPKQPAPYVPPAPLEQPTIEAPTLKDVIAPDTNKDQAIDRTPRGRQSTILPVTGGDDLSGTPEATTYKKKLLGS